MTGPSRNEALRRLSTRADLVAAMIAAAGVLPESEQVKMLENCRCVAEGLFSELSTITKGGVQ